IQKDFLGKKPRTRITLTRPPSAGVSRLPLTAAAATRAGAIPCDEPLFHHLCSLRKELADARDVPPYVIFSDVSLRHMARTYPANEGELLAVPGVGERKLADFGRDFIGAITAWLAAHPRLEFADTRPRARSRKMKSVAGGLSGTVLETVRLWRAGKTIDQIAQTRRLVHSTIESHLAQALEAGEPIDVRTFYDEADEHEMEHAFVGHEGPALAPVFEKLGGRISYGKLRIFQAARARQGSSPGAKANG
ncbi:MAG: helix-turn-helix domain-containing protein, partial [Chthoniobacteraceae bacterium]